MPQPRGTGTGAELKRIPRAYPVDPGWAEGVVDARRFVGDAPVDDLCNRFAPPVDDLSNS